MKKTYLLLACIFCLSLTVFAQTASDYIIAAKQGNAEAQCNLGTCILMVGASLKIQPRRLNGGGNQRNKVMPKLKTN